MNQLSYSRRKSGSWKVDCRGAPSPRCFAWRCRKYGAGILFHSILILILFVREKFSELKPYFSVLDCNASFCGTWLRIRGRNLVGHVTIKLDSTKNLTRILKKLSTFLILFSSLNTKWFQTKRKCSPFLFLVIPCLEYVAWCVKIHLLKLSSKMLSRRSDTYCNM